jgi:predicted NBD/HSP70 family sugar kinase
MTLGEEVPSAASTPQHSGGAPLPTLDADVASLLAVVRRLGPLTRAEMTASTGWARVTVTSRLERLLEVGLLTVDDTVAGARGRPAARYRVDARRAVLLVADVGAQGMRLARVDLEGHVEATVESRADIGSGPEEVLQVVRAGLEALASSAAGRPVWGAGISLPGPVDFAAGRVVSPPIMTGWDGYPVRDTVSGWFGCPVLVENDVNAIAVGERAMAFPSLTDLLVVKVGTGVGCGIISAGEVMRGAAGAAGDIGHTWADVGDSEQAPPDCRCGKRGCVEAYVGGWALARDIGSALGRSVTIDEVRQMLVSGDPTAVRLVRDAGRILGGSLASAISLLNPSAVVLSGQIAVDAGEHLLAGLRERIYSRALPLATRDLDISVSKLWPDSGVHGLARGVGHLVLSRG